MALKRYNHLKRMHRSQNNSFNWNVLYEEENDLDVIFIVISSIVCFETC
jgi:hypothetical protein